MYAANVVLETTLPVEEEVVVETNQHQFSCDLCDEEDFRTSAEFERHRREDHGEEGKFK